MDCLNHMTQGFLMTAIPVSLINTDTGIVCGVTSGIIGGLPDIIGEYYAYIKKDHLKTI